jgi:hypothetical protein
VFYRFAPPRAPEGPAAGQGERLAAEIESVAVELLPRLTPAPVLAGKETRQDFLVGE